MKELVYPVRQNLGSGLFCFLDSSVFGRRVDRNDPRTVPGVVWPYGYGPCMVVIIFLVMQNSWFAFLSHDGLYLPKSAVVGLNSHWPWKWQIIKLKFNKRFAAAALPPGILHWRFSIRRVDIVILLQISPLMRLSLWWTTGSPHLCFAVRLECAKVLKSRVALADVGTCTSRLGLACRLMVFEKIPTLRFLSAAALKDGLGCIVVPCMLTYRQPMSHPIS